MESIRRYIYTDGVKLTTIEHACGLCYVAKKYMFPFLVNQCMSYIWKDVKYPMAFKAYEFAKLFDETDLMERCKQIISQNTTLVLNGTNSEDIELSTLLELLDCEQLNISSELELVTAVYRWALSQCVLKGIEQNKENLRDVIGPALSKIRFLTLLPAEFASSFEIQELLTQDEAFSLLMKISSPSTVSTLPDGFSISTTSRCNSSQPTTLTELRPFWCERTIVQQMAILNENQLICKLTFTVNKDIVMHGITMPSQLGENSEHVAPLGLCSTNRENTYVENITVDLLNRSRRKIAHGFVQTSVGFKQLMDINFIKPAFICANTNYTVVVELHCPGSYPIGKYSKHTNVCAGACFTFCVGDPSESVRNSIIRSIIFSQPSFEIFSNLGSATFSQPTSTRRNTLLF